MFLFAEFWIYYRIQWIHTCLHNMSGSGEMPGSGCLWKVCLLFTILRIVHDNTCIYTWSNNYFWIIRQLYCVNNICRSLYIQADLARDTERLLNVCSKAMKVRS